MGQKRGEKTKGFEKDNGLLDSKAGVCQNRGTVLWGTPRSPF